MCEWKETGRIMGEQSPTISTRNIRWHDFETGHIYRVKQG